ncbi:hypothetical protein [Vibrio scophthalmi]|uniref:Uncharacterized protein n=1 Tax=Vibrio scophthalmi LMG 19158 TaxID=870967 RepID=F9RLQ6_9VIBR|nr:hypothetical protein [Vibrio scophthalmi]EGU38814.1 hypothetical protein VIS19158_04841 [Vibrio scophthalmi LMG 19158]
MRKQRLGCGYMGFDNRIPYPVSRCFDGFMLVSDDALKEEYARYTPIPCPMCNAKRFVKSYVAEKLWLSGYQSLSPTRSSASIEEALNGWSANSKRMGMRFYRAGRRQAIRETKLTKQIVNKRNGL